MKPVLKRLFDHLIRIGKQDLSSPSRSGYYQPDSRKLKEILNKEKNKAAGKSFKFLVVLCMAVMTVFNVTKPVEAKAEETRLSALTLDTVYFEMTDEEIEAAIIAYLDSVFQEEYKVIHYEQAEPIGNIINSSEFTGVYQDKTRSFYPPGQAGIGSSFPNGGSISYDPHSGSLNDSWGVTYAGITYTVTMPRGAAQVGSVYAYNYNVPPTTQYVRLYMTRVDRSNFYRVTSYTQNGTVVNIVPVTGLHSLTPQLIYS